LRPAWFGALAVALLVIAWLSVHSLPGALTGCLFLAVALTGHARQRRLRRIRFDRRDRWSGAFDDMGMRELAPARQVVLPGLILLRFRIASESSYGDVALTSASAGPAALRRLAVRLRFASPHGAGR
jgi:hypothetical protein